jgi:hypothetical protein
MAVREHGSKAARLSDIFYQAVSQYGSDAVRYYGGGKTVREQGVVR